MSVALVTNYIPPYRAPLYELLAQRYGVEVFCFGGEASYVADHHRQLVRQIGRRAFPGPRAAPRARRAPGRPRSARGHRHGQRPRRTAGCLARRPPGAPSIRPVGVTVAPSARRRTRCSTRSMRRMYTTPIGAHLRRARLALCRPASRQRIATCPAPQAVERRSCSFATSIGRQRGVAPDLADPGRTAPRCTSAGSVHEKGVETLFEAWDVCTVMGRSVPRRKGPLPSRESPHVVYARSRRHRARCRPPTRLRSGRGPLTSHAAFLERGPGARATRP